jgi:hypothetical protein
VLKAHIGERQVSPKNSARKTKYLCAKLELSTYLSPYTKIDKN